MEPASAVIYREFKWSLPVPKCSIDKNVKIYHKHKIQPQAEYISVKAYQ
jgi:hypothetical protein